MCQTHFYWLSSITTRLRPHRSRDRSCGRSSSTPSSSPNPSGLSPAMGGSEEGRQKRADDEILEAIDGRRGVRSGFSCYLSLSLSRSGRRLVAPTYPTSPPQYTLSGVPLLTTTPPPCQTARNGVRHIDHTHSRTSSAPPIRHLGQRLNAGTDKCSLSCIDSHPVLPRRAPLGISLQASTSNVSVSSLFVTTARCSQFVFWLRIFVFIIST